MKHKSKLKSKTMITGAMTVLGAVIYGLEAGYDTKTVIIGALGAVMIVLRQLTTEPVK